MLLLDNLVKKVRKKYDTPNSRVVTNLTTTRASTRIASGIGRDQAFTNVYDRTKFICDKIYSKVKSSIKFLQLQNFAETHSRCNMEFRKNTSIFPHLYFS